MDTRSVEDVGIRYFTMFSENEEQDEDNQLKYTNRAFLVSISTGLVDPPQFENLGNELVKEFSLFELSDQQIRLG